MATTKAKGRRTKQSGVSDNIRVVTRVEKGYNRGTIMVWSRTLSFSSGELTNSGSEFSQQVDLFGFKLPSGKNKH